MGKNIHKQQKSAVSNEEVKLPGTLIAVLLLGVLMLVSWFGIYALFLTR